MKIVLCKDDTVDIDLKKFCDVLNRHANYLRFESINSVILLPDKIINNPTTYQKIKYPFKKSSEKIYIIVTSKPYDNNFFFDASDNVIIISFYAWNSLTDLPISNGLSFFLVSILADHYKIGSLHYENTGCLNDFWADKTGVDIGMKAAFICPSCQAKTDFDDPTVKAIYDDIIEILNLISISSRKGRDIIDAIAESDAVAEFDIFLCHNSEDKEFIRIISNQLKENGLKVWLDEEQLSPGRPWQIELENQIKKIKGVAVFVGRNGIGPWQQNEIRAFLSEFVNRDCPVIPVILPDATSVPELPIFLKQMTWIDLRKDFPKGIKRLCMAVKD